MKRKETLAYELTNNILFSDASYTYDEYVTYLLQLHATILKIFFGENYDSCLRLNDGYSCLKQIMIKYKLMNGNAYPIYEKAMKILERELAIALAGKNAENRIHHLLTSHLNHEEMATYRNVYLQHGKENCEIDEIILTRNALLLFEIKNTSADIIIDKHGRLYQNNRTTYSSHSLIHNIRTKEIMLKDCMKEKLKDRKVHIDYLSDAYVVFTSAYNTNIRVYDHCHQVPWTTDQNLVKLMKKYQRYIPISTSEYETLKSILDDLQEAKKPFASPIDFHEILDVLLAMLDEVFFYCDPVEQLHREHPHCVSLMLKHCLQALKQAIHKKKLTLSTDFGDFYF